MGVAFAWARIVGFPKVPLREPTPSINTWTDDFNSSTLDTRWSWIGEDPTHWSLISHPDFMRITTSIHSSVGDPKNILIQSMPSSDFSVETKVIFQPVQDGHFAGFLIMQDSVNYLKLGRMNNNGEDSFVFWSREEENWSGTEIPYPTNQDDYYLHIARYGENYSGYVSMNGENWTSLGTITINFSPTAIGLMAIDTIQDKDEISADFDFFKIISK